ncbi:MAG: hypothetical protein A3D10_07215 [Omnitrophica WOR_2 bacterium RIFCSPHIGHO2_02_FULL_48_11]|nr:MAG: hypothetical protein A3D10_07215 [Omnitrophica WOR_2 bacterium RIFCSPHIGHO2_02_FULL_48_11]
MQYDVLASLQKEIGRELVKKIDSLDDVRFILDVGMGTGWMTNRLANLFPDAKVIGLDCAFGMLEQACKKYEGLYAIQADARALPFKGEVFDVVISNLAYQWVADLNKAFAESHRLLKKNGTLCLTMFGRETLKELFTSLEAVNGEKFAVQRLANRTAIEASLKESHFENITLETETIKVHFPDMLSLVKWLKDIGANILPKNGFVGKELMLEAGEFYQTNFSDRLGIIATFEVVWIKAQK